MSTRIGLKEFKIAAVLTDPFGGSPTWDTPISIPGAITASQKAVGDIAKLYADDGIADVNEIFAGVDLDLEFNEITPENYATLLGHLYASGGMTKSKSDVSPYFAVGFKVQKNDGKYNYYWLYKVKFKKPDENAATKKESTEWQTYKFMAVGIPLESTGQISFMMTNSDPAYDTTKWANFFTQVTTASADTTALTAAATVGAGGDAGKVVITFTKGSAASFSLNTNTVTSITAMIGNASGFIAGTYAISGAGTSVTVKFTPTVAFNPGDVVSVVVTNQIKDNSNVAATAMIDQLTF